MLIDTSAVARPVRDRDVLTDLELLHSARSKADREEWLELFAATFA
ncbi:hypothetical protein ABT297_11315 [Dactylosporangium sp. NPDC000555]